MLFNCNELHLHNQRLSLDVNINESCFLLVSTNFSLPFSKWNNRPQERLNWLRYRYQMWKKYTYSSLKNLHIPFGQSIWLVFMQNGDRKILNLRNFECFSNGLILIYVEVNKIQDVVNDDFYRQKVVPKLINTYLNFFMIKKTTHSVLTLRLDSDDIIHKNYLAVISQILKRANISHLKDITFCYSHGLQNRVREEKISPKVWGESPFILRLESFK